MTVYKYNECGWYVGESSKVKGCEDRVVEIAPENKSVSEVVGGLRSNWTGYKWVEIAYYAPIIEKPIDPEKPYKWHLDVGAFFDRFADAKIAVLASDSAIAQAVIRDCQVRKWIDVKAESTEQGIAELVSLGLVSESLAASILGTPAAPSENSALRRIYYGEPM